jgi:hypothetical protein
MSMTLEGAVESAFSAVLRTYQPELAEVRINLACFGLNQTEVVSDTQPVEYQPMPCITLTAMSGEELVRNSGAYSVMLEIRVETSAVAEDGAMSIDDLYNYATRPLIYASPSFVSVMDAGEPTLRMHGINRRQSTSDQEAGDAFYARTKTVEIVCALR